MYVADEANDRVMRWTKDATKGQALVGDNGRGSRVDQLNGPASASLDDRGNLYIVDQDNHRIQRFDVQSTVESDRQK